MKIIAQSKKKMDPEKAPAPVKKLIEAVKDDIMDRRCIQQYIEECPAGTFVGPSEPLSPMGETQPGEWEYIKK